VKVLSGAHRQDAKSAKNPRRRILSNPVTFASVASFLFIVAQFASLLPERRATRVDPIVVLRYE